MPHEIFQSSERHHLDCPFMVARGEIRYKDRSEQGPDRVQPDGLRREIRCGVGFQLIHIFRAVKRGQQHVQRVLGTILIWVVERAGHHGITRVVQKSPGGNGIPPETAERELLWVNAASQL